MPAIATRFTVAAYGQMLAVHAANAALAGTSEASFKSNLGYSGEQWDASLRMQNLRARAYDPRNGRFIGLDPFSGNMQDPQSLHKYAYVHGDPIQALDPTGLSALVSVSIPVAIGGTFGAIGGGAAAFNLGYDFDDPEFWLTLAAGTLLGGLTGHFAIGGAATVPVITSKSLYLIPALATFGYFSIDVATATRSPTTAESKKIRDAVVLIGSTPGFYEDYLFLTQLGLFGPEFTFQVSDDLHADYYGKAFPHQNDTMVIRRDAVDLPTPILASLILHESVHNRQSIGTRLREQLREPPAYERQSLFMKAVGASGSQAEIRRNLILAGYAAPTVLTHWLTDQVSSFIEFGTPDPAVRQ